MITLEDIRNELQKKLQLDQLLRSVEVHADTLDEALADAAVQLQTRVQFLEYEVIERGSDGFMGIAKKPWVINAYETAEAVAEKEKKKKKGDASASEEDSDIEVIQDKDAEFFVHYFDGLIMLKIVPPIGNGANVDAKEVIASINTGDSYQFKEADIKRIVDKGDTDGQYEQIGTFIQNPVNDAIISVEVSMDEMTCSIIATAPMSEGGELQADYIERQLEKQNITIGINEEKISAFVDKPVYGIPYVVAEGIKPVDGHDAYIKYNFETDRSKIRIKESASGQVNFKELNLIQNVVEGQPLAQKMLAERGKAGKTLYGRYLEAKNGKDIPIPLGKNVKLDTDGRTIVATCNGQVLLSGSKINVEPVMEVESVNIKTGNITFLGTVIVKGNVDDGFNVKASGNIEVYGTVGNSQIEADGDIIVSLGIMGRDEGTVKCGRSLWAKFIQNTTVEVEENVIVADGIINSNVTCNKRIILQGKRAAIIGGHLFATEEINAKSIGSNGGGSETVLEVGFDPRKKQRLDDLQARQAEVQHELEEVNLNMSTLENQKQMRKTLPQDKEEALALLYRKKGDLMDETDSIAAEIQEIQDYLRELKVIGKVSASGTVYPGVKLYIRDVKEDIRTEIKSVTFYLENGFVRQGKYEPVSDDVKRTPDGYSAN
ncbi:MAG: FapA family protein [Spirochaetaceae bacterium]|nr:FapA family protein [Spirochaetaceae bacterium]